MIDSNLDSIPARFYSWNQLDKDTGVWAVKTCHARGYSVFEGKLLLFWATGESPLVTVPAGEWEGLKITKQPPTENDPVQPEPPNPKGNFFWT